MTSDECLFVSRIIESGPIAGKGRCRCENEFLFSASRLACPASSLCILYDFLFRLLNRRCSWRKQDISQCHSFLVRYANTFACVLLLMPWQLTLASAQWYSTRTLGECNAKWNMSSRQINHINDVTLHWKQNKWSAVTRTLCFSIRFILVMFFALFSVLVCGMHSKGDFWMSLTKQTTIIIALIVIT